MGSGIIGTLPKTGFMSRSPVGRAYPRAEFSRDWKLLWLVSSLAPPYETILESGWNGCQGV